MKKIDNLTPEIHVRVHVLCAAIRMLSRALGRELYRVAPVSLADKWACDSKQQWRALAEVQDFFDNAACHRKGPGCLDGTGLDWAMHFSLDEAPRELFAGLRDLVRACADVDLYKRLATAGARTGVRARTSILDQEIWPRGDK